MRLTRLLNAANFHQIYNLRKQLPPEKWIEKDRMIRRLLTLTAKCVRAKFGRYLAVDAVCRSAGGWESVDTTDGRMRMNGTRKTRINEDEMESKGGRPTRCVELVEMVSVGSDGGNTRCDPTNY